MRNACIRYSVGDAIAGTICLLLGVLFLGCTRESATSKPVASVAARTPPAVAPAGTAVEPSAATAPVDDQATTLVAGKVPSKGDEKTVKVGACDGGQAVEVSQTLTGQALADSLLDHWKRNHPEANWVAEEKERHALKPPADNSDVLQGSQGKGHTYGNYTERDLLTWARETEKFVAEGSRIFHSGDELGSSVSVSCDMCHPHAANTHPETYPKFQPQLGRVALLRDMIDWCIENPVRGERLDPNGPKMRALEAYIYSQRKGVPMNFGKH